MFNQDFYHSTMRKYVSLFGTLFAEINISRSVDGESTTYIKVPITYASKDKMLARVQQAEDANRLSATVPLPIMSFEMVGSLSYDGDRKLHGTGRNVAVDRSRPNNLTFQHYPVPYDIHFNLYVYVKNSEDGTKIIEQILPYFKPDFTVQVDLIPELNILMEVPIILNSAQLDDNHTGPMTDKVSTIWVLSFTVKGNFYGPVKSAPIIKFADANLKIPDPSVTIQEAVGANTGTYYTVTTSPGLTANGEPTSNAALSVNTNIIIATDDFGYITTHVDTISE